ncbi:SDR family oxidoreductase [Planococcus lenghuensis]|uniref:Sugar epimerase n=1 Tax=Planococcus lenghuensis TaxID=2213202 RepID=A0A1Q2L2V4_9BACL|nr:SDR family oxidoreductase [Planococcus lenghuensis]AQQ54746.1 sugar epimerase [Planococcus lenghuensis]
MKVLIAGANGQIGKHLVKFIQEDENLEAKAMIRSEEQAAYFEDLGAEVAVVNLQDDIDVIAKAAEGADAVVFTAGSGPHTGPDKTLMIDLDGAVKTIEAAKQANVKRFVMVSSFSTDREAIQSAPESFAPYVVAKHYADEWLKSTDLDYTIVHPGALTNDPGSNRVELAERVNVKEDSNYTDSIKVPREDIARVIVATLKNDATIGKSFQVIGGDTPVPEAVESI